MSVNFEELKEKLRGDELLVMKFLPNAKKRGHELVCGDIDGSSGESFSFNIKSGLWSDFSTGESGDSLIALVASQKNMSYKEAAEFLAPMASVEVRDISNRAQNRERKGENAGTTSPIAPKTIWRDGVNIPIVAKWEYKSKKGLTIGYDCRIEDEETGRKEIIPMRWEDGKFKQGALLEPRPLYQSDKLAESNQPTVIIGEGCKTADAIQHYFPNYVATTWQGGCKATHKADWEQLRDRKVIIVPDADEVGREAANKIGASLHGIAQEIKIVDTTVMEHVKKGWDIADAKEAGMPQKDVIKLFKDNLRFFTPIYENNEPIEPNVVVAQYKTTKPYDDKYFICLGIIGHLHYFYHKASGQVLCFQPSQYTKNNLISLADVAYWNINYPSKQGTDWLQAANDICRIQETAGIFDLNRLRGLGAWFDKGTPVIHLGGSLYVNGQAIQLDDFQTDYIYEKKPSIAVKLQTVLPVEESKKFIEILRLARWEKPHYGDILAGWIFSAIVCGAMPFRSHLYLIGARGSGKSWVLENIVRPVMGGMCIPLSSKTTEAGVRASLSSNVLPVVLDEAEGESIEDKKRLQAIIDLSRSASSENAAPIVKGSMGGGGAVSYLVRSSFLFASINSTMSKSADLSRTTFIKLKNLNHPTDAEKKADFNKFKKLDEYVSKTFDDDYCRCLITRAIRMIPILRDVHKMVADCAAKEFGSRRLGDQMGMPLAGIWCLQNDRMPTADEVRNLITTMAIQDDKEDDDDQTQEEQALDKFLFTELQMSNNKRFIISMLLSNIAGVMNTSGVDANDAEEMLRSRGVMIKNDRLYLSLKAEALPSEIYSNSDWGVKGWREALLRLEGARREEVTYFTKSLYSRGISIPLSLFIHDDLIIDKLT